MLASRNLITTSATGGYARTRTHILDKLRAGLEAQTLADLEIGWMMPRPMAGSMAIVPRTGVDFCG